VSAYTRLNTVTVWVDRDILPRKGQQVRSRAYLREKDGSFQEFIGRLALGQPIGQSEMLATNRKGEVVACCLQGWKAVEI